MFDPDALIDEYESLAHGAVRLQGIRRAIAEADAAKDAYWQLQFRYDYIHEAVFYEDTIKALAAWSEYISIFDAHPEIEPSPLDLLWLLRWLLEALRNIPQISLEHCLALFEEFKNRSRSYGYGLATYYRDLGVFYASFDREKALAAFESYEQAPPGAHPYGRLSNCTACDVDDRTFIALLKDDVHQALCIARPILTGRKRCEEVPQCTYHNLIRWYMLQQRPAEAASYAERLYPLVKRNIHHLHMIGDLIAFYSFIDFEKALRYFKCHLDWYIRTLAANSQFCFARGAWRLFLTIRQKNKETLQLLLPNNFPAYQSDGTYDVQQLQDYFYQQAVSFAKQFDQRNGNTAYQNSLDSLLY